MRIIVNLMVYCLGNYEGPWLIPFPDISGVFLVDSKYFIALVVFTMRILNLFHKLSS